MQTSSLVDAGDWRISTLYILAMTLLFGVSVFYPKLRPEHLEYSKKAYAVGTVAYGWPKSYAVFSATAEREEDFFVAESIEYGDLPWSAHSLQHISYIATVVNSIVALCLAGILTVLIRITRSGQFSVGLGLMLVSLLAVLTWAFTQTSGIGVFFSENGWSASG